MSDFKVGSTVKLKGGNQLMTVTQLREYNCEVTWTIDGGEINSYTFQLSALEIVPEKEVAQERKRYNRRENAKVGLSGGEQFSKYASPIAAILSALVLAFQAYTISGLKEKIDFLVNALKIKTTQSEKEDSPKTPE
ncbi:hypothetical protein LPTSP2_36660 [Leptospira ellinghausenii]|uniref:Uncharacterized protein n=1 Tax=Leptospira ellinghausenii TaxID=1917822 RepID=A0A2P2DI95_9LEPT|nr:hypothetical protein [Leptospira ellinghausenii]GBF44363.1 hypothetical protein LPTSP2_36660 [Leptospira ellinghausenii]